VWGVVEKGNQGKERSVLCGGRSMPYMRCNCASRERDPLRPGRDLVMVQGYPPRAWQVSVPDETMEGALRCFDGMKKWR